MLGVLREEGAETAIAPYPGLEDIDTLIASMRASGLPVRYVREGRPDAVDATMALAIYRIVQESLTNTLKHSGPGTPTTVVCRHTPNLIEVDILDEGSDRPMPTEGSDRPMPTTGTATGTGHGLSGIRERVALFAGNLTAGPTPPGGWRVHATFPTPRGSR
jgi:signal transduction histidine kinase